MTKCIRRNAGCKKYASEVISKEDVVKRRIRNFLRQDEQQLGAFLK